MAALWIAIVAWLIAASFDDGSASYMHSQEHMNEIYEKGLERTGRHRRSSDCFSLVTFSSNGYSALERENVEVDFLLIGKNKHVARVKWQPPKGEVQNSTIDEFLISWEDNLFRSKTNCTLVSNETTTYNITASSKSWNVLHIIIRPLPMIRGAYSQEFLRFTPTYSGERHTTPAPSVTEKTTKEHHTYESAPHEYSSKLIIGCVIGVSIAIVLIIIFVKSYIVHFVPSSHKDTYYISYYPESMEFVKEVKKFACWLLSNGFDIQMLTEENDMLTEENMILKLEQTRFTFRELMVKSSDKVFLILSPVYLKLCNIGKDDAINQNFSEEEKLVNGEIVQIRWELHENMYRSDRFIPICFGLNESSIMPFWIKELAFFFWPEDKTNQKLLNSLNGLPECPLDDRV